VLRWSRFVQGDIDQYMKNVQALPPSTASKCASTARAGKMCAEGGGRGQHRPGPDIILGTYDDANLYPEKLVDVTDLCNYLGKKYGGWYPTCELYLKPTQALDRRAARATGSMMVYRESQVKAAGFQSFPKDTDSFLR